jgi:hypothetical protein
VKANGSGLYNWAVGLTKVNARLLVKTLGNETCFVMINRAISFVFETKKPFAANNIHVGSVRNKSSSAVAKESIKFSIHSITPGLVFRGSSVGGRFNVIWASSGNESFWEWIAIESIRKGPWFEDVVLRARLHAMLRRRQRWWGIQLIGQNLQWRRSSVSGHAMLRKSNTGGASD